jgi:hypothetical protein
MSATTEARLRLADKDEHQLSALARSYIDWPALWAEDDPAEDWLLAPLIARGRGHALYAPAKAGKSLITGETVFALTAGRPFLGYSGDPIHVLYVDYEMTRADVRERLMTFGYTERNAAIHSQFLHYASLPSIPSLDSAEGGEMVADEAVRVGAQLVVIDTVGRSVRGSENENDTYLDFYANTGLLLKQEEVALWRLDHSGKDGTKGQRGASAKNDDVDIVWSLERGDNNALKLKCTHRRVAWVPDEVHLAWRVTDRDEETGEHYIDDHDVTQPAGTHNVVVPFLTRHKVPLDWGRPKVKRLMLEHEIHVSNAAITAGINWRRSRASSRNER